MKTEIKAYTTLSLNELYDLLRLRTDVFVVEQNCPYPELDGKDKKAYHFIGTINDNIIATARILPHGVSYPELSIGRVVVDEAYRKGEVGKEMMIQVLAFIAEKWPNTAVRISAQSHLSRFYGRLGFEETGKAYLEDGIPHVEMILKGSD